MMILRDKLGWPVELFKGRPVTNFIRKLLHTSIWQTWKWRKGLPGNMDAERHAAINGSAPTRQPDGDAGSTDSGRGK